MYELEAWLLGLFVQLSQVFILLKIFIWSYVSLTVVSIINKKYCDYKKSFPETLGIADFNITLCSEKSAMER